MQLEEGYHKNRCIRIESLVGYAYPRIRIPFYFNCLFLSLNDPKWYLRILLNFILEGQNLTFRYVYKAYKLIVKRRALAPLLCNQKFQLMKKLRSEIRSNQV